MKHFSAFLLLIFLSIFSSAQESTVIGIETGGIWYMPAHPAMDHGPGFSGKLFYERWLLKRVNAVFDAGFTRLSSDVFLRWPYPDDNGAGYPDVGQYQTFDEKVLFDYLTVLVGWKYFFTEKFFIHPSIGVYHALTGSVANEKNSVNAKLAFGFNFRRIYPSLGYVFGLQDQLSIHQVGNTGHMGVNPRSRYFEFSIAIPLKTF